MSNYRAIIVNDTPADDIPSLLKAKAKLISNQNKGDGFYVIIGGWQGKTYGFSIGNVIGGKITIACFLNNNCYLATCDYSNPESNFSYTTMKPDLSPYITKSQLFAAQSQSFLVNKSTTIDGTLFSTANFKAQRPNNGTGAASYGFENIGINSGALYLDPTDYKLHFINYEGKDFTKYDQERLAYSLKKTLAKFVLVIKNTEFISSLYEKDFNILSFDKQYTYNVKSRNNRDVEHLIITNLPV